MIHNYLDCTYWPILVSTLLNAELIVLAYLLLSQKNWQTKEGSVFVSVTSGVSRLFQADSASGHEKMRATEALIADTLTTISARFELA